MKEGTRFIFNSGDLGSLSDIIDRLDKIEKMLQISGTVMKSVEKHGLPKQAGNYLFFGALTKGFSICSLDINGGIYVINGFQVVERHLSTISHWLNLAYLSKE